MPFADGSQSEANRSRGLAGFQRPPSGGVDGEVKGHEAQVSRSPISQERGALQSTKRSE